MFIKNKIEILLDSVLDFFFPDNYIRKKVRQMNLDDFLTLKEVSVDGDGIISFFKYKSPLIREAVRQFKYKRNLKITRIFAEIIYAELLEEISDLLLFENFQKPILVPVPMSKKEKRVRGYNQVELLIKEIKKLDDGNLDYDFNLLRKVRDNPRQTGLKKKERLENIKGVFEAKSEVEGKNIILIDDVITTGATINEAKFILKNTGARKVLVAVIAC